MPKPKPSDDDKPKRGRPTTNTLKVEGEWEEAVGRALEREKPKGGWPKPRDEKAKKQQRRRT